jgi:flavin reductase (DIM6/NTAB) family NADH-FMN oxidoreductase RutF
MPGRHAVPPTTYSFPCSVQLVGVYREDGRPTFSMHTWMTTASCEPPTLMFSVYAARRGVKKTSDSILRSGVFSVNLITQAMLHDADYCGQTSGYKTDKVADRGLAWSPGALLDVPVLDGSPWVYECRLVDTKDVGECTVLFGRVEHLTVDASIADASFGKVDVPTLDLAVYSTPAYYGLGERVYGEGDSVKAGESATP